MDHLGNVGLSHHSSMVQGAYEILVGNRAHGTDVFGSSPLVTDKFPLPWVYGQVCN